MKSTARRGPLALLAAALSMLALAACGSNTGSKPQAHNSHKAKSTPAAKTRKQTSTGHATSTTGTVPAARTGTTTAPSGPVPADFGPQSFTAISDSEWWLLGDAPCTNKPCTSVVRTDNGGQSFVGTPAPRTSKVSQLRFASAKDGYAFGPQLWSTSDSGEQWTQVQVGGTVNALAAGGGYVFALVRANGSLQLKRAVPGSDTWTAVKQLPDDPQGSLWVQGSTVIVATLTGGGNSGPVFVSNDSGQSFSQVGQTPNGLACALSTPPGSTSVIWAACATGMMGAVSRSTNGGRSFTTARQDGSQSGGAHPEFSNSLQVAGFSAAGAIASSGQELYRTTDGGQSWTAVSGMPSLQWTYLGFTDATHGVAIGVANQSASGAYELYYTSDAGQSYHRVQISGS